MQGDSSQGGERVFIGLGSNLGDRHASLDRALVGLAALPRTEVVRVSTFRETEPWGVSDQPMFLNAVAELRCSLEPLELLDRLKELEATVGRTPTYRWGPREIDLDLLLFGGRRVEHPRLTLPHPHILERSFVFEPLAEIAPEVVEALRHARLSL